MTRTTIDFGIDLGTTNSSIAVLQGIETDVIKNNEGFEYTPSAVWVDQKGRLIVGRRAKERLENDQENAFCEFKLQMGKDKEYTFTRSGRRMKPEDLSAEVLKALKADVAQRRGEEVQAAVITVPAAFTLPQCEATKKAAQKAGFVSSPLLQEPVAAALAYGFQDESEKAFWLVYDFGGGTFDAAVIQVRDGAPKVVNHDGDNNLGGKLIDWEIVEQLLIPAVAKEHPLTDFRRGNLKWSAAMAKLKLKAEEAKIRLSRDESAEIIIDFLCTDDRGDQVSFEYELQRRDVERLAEPFILSSVNICKKVLAKKRLGIESIDKVLLVGGPTLTPYLRERLADRKDGLGIPLEFSHDPLTVVARGAAIFAGTQRNDGIVLPPPAVGQYAIELDYKPMGADTEPLVGGKVMAAEGENLSGFSVQFVNAGARPPWRSGRVGLAPDGMFMTNLWAEKGRTNTFAIELFDATGTRRETVPATFPYTVGCIFEEIPLTHSVGVELIGNKMDWYFEKGTSLPVRKRCICKTTITKDGMIIIPVLEGGNPRADRNVEIGRLEINAHRARRDVPTNSEIEITIEIDQSRLVRVKAYLPILDEEYENVLKLEGKAPDPEKLAQDAALEKKRLENARKRAQDTGDRAAQQALQRIDSEQMEHQVESSLNAAQADGDAADKAQSRLLDLKTAIDQVEDALEWPALVAQAKNEVEVERKIINDPYYEATAEERSAFARLERELDRCITENDADCLRQKMAEMDGLGFAIVLRKPAWWVARLEEFEKKRGTMSDPALAERYLEQGRRAINNNEFEGLKAAVRQLYSLLPIEDPTRGTFDKTTIFL